LALARSHPPEPKTDRIEVTPAEMAAILEGIDLKLARRQRRFVLPALTPS
jgi:transposase